MRMVWPVVVVVAAAASTVFGERIYDQPYLGRDNPEWKTFQSFRAWGTPAPGGLAEVVRGAEVILIGDAGPLKVIPPREGVKVPRYAGSVTVVDVMKGTLAEKSLPLEWQATAAGIEDKPSRHVFFMSKAKDGSWDVARGLYVYSNASFPKMYLYGATPVDRELGLMAIGSLIDDKAEVKGLKEKLLANDDTGKFYDFYSAVMLATELDPKYGEDVLRRAAAATGKQFDIDLYARAVLRLASKYGAAGVQAILDGLPAVEAKGERRLLESMAFWAIGTYGKPEFVPAVRTFVKDRPAYVVSAAWALAEIGGDDARATVEGWRKDAVLAGQTVRTANGLGRADMPAGALLDQALAAMKPN